MARFVMASRRAGKFHESEKKAARDEVAGALGRLSGYSLVREPAQDGELDRRVVVFDADPGEVNAKQNNAEFPPDVLIEPEIIHRRLGPPPLPPLDLCDASRAPLSVQPAASAASATISVTGGGQPLPNATVTLWVRGWGMARSLGERLTGANGDCTFTIPTGYEVSAAVVVPEGNFWSMLVRGLELTRPIECPPLPGSGPLAWWHGMMGIGQYDPARGENIKVGVLDTGLADHPDLAHAVGVGAFIGTEFFPGRQAADDVDSHGTHVMGIIGGRPAGSNRFAGIAPGCELYMARVFPDADSGASNGDIAKAIDRLASIEQVDLINMSLGASVKSKIVEDAVIAAMQTGTLCVCAAGNENGPVSYPAALKEAVAVSALGLSGWGPAGSLAASRLPSAGDRFGHENLYQDAEKRADAAPLPPLRRPEPPFRRTPGVTVPPPAAWGGGSGCRRRRSA